MTCIHALGALMPRDPACTCVLSPTQGEFDTPYPAASFALRAGGAYVIAWVITSFATRRLVAARDKRARYAPSLPEAPALPPSGASLAQFIEMVPPAALARFDASDASSASETHEEGPAREPVVDVFAEDDAPATTDAAPASAPAPAPDVPTPVPIGDVFAGDDVPAQAASSSAPAPEPATAPSERDTDAKFSDVAKAPEQALEAAPVASWGNFARSHIVAAMLDVRGARTPRAMTVWVTLLLLDLLFGAIVNSQVEMRSPFHLFWTLRNTGRVQCFYRF